MFHHVVLFSLKPQHRNELGSLLTDLEALPGRIPEIVRLSCGVNLRHDSYGAALIADFHDEAAFATYRDHPAHRPVADALWDFAEEIAVADFTT